MVKMRVYLDGDRLAAITPVPSPARPGPGGDETTASSGAVFAGSGPAAGARLRQVDVDYVDLRLDDPDGASGIEQRVADLLRQRTDLELVEADVRSQPSSS
jgi:hypothetical protein